MSLESSVLEFVEAGLFRDAAAMIDRADSVPSSVKVLRSHLEVHVGSPQKARETARTLLRTRLTATDRTRCLEVIGRVSLSIGELDEGLRTIRGAVELAETTENPTLEVRVIASYVEALLHCVGVEPAAVEIPRLRRYAVHCGDAYSLVALHSLVAEIKAKKGLIAGALASIETARQLQKGFANVWQQGRLAVAHSGVAIIQSDYDSALASTAEVMACATRSGSRELRIPALGNLALIKLAKRELKEAEQSLQELLQAVRKGGGTEIGVLDTQMQLSLARGDLELAASQASEISALSLELEAGHSYYGLWHLITRVRWLYRTGEAVRGLAQAIDAMPQIERAADKNLTQRMLLLAAEGLGRLDRTAEGAHLMARAVNGNPDPPLDIIAEAARVAGRLASKDDRGAALAHFLRAARILERVGNLTALADVERDAVEVLGLSESARRTDEIPGSILSTAQRYLPVDGRPAAAPFSERLSTLVELGANPPLLGTESFALIAEAKVVLNAAVIEIFPDGRRELVTAYSAPGSPAAVDDHPDAVKIALGTHRDRQYAIVAIPHPTASARATLLAVERLVHTALTLARARQQEREQAALWPDHTPEQQLGLVCSSERMLDLIKTIRRVAASNLTVLLTGETGVGKELFARALHLASPRRERTFLPFNCTAVPREMLDSQLFGYRRGAFTGAHDDAPGLIRAAAGGTLFLDEIGEMSPEAQPKLLRFIESGEILPLGEPRPQLVDVRIVAATNADLDQLVSDGRFREDLFYRLNVIPIHIPPLRERREEVPALVDVFLERFGREMQKPMLRVADETLEYLLLYRWPGNVRQLANEIRRLVALAEPGSTLMPSQLSADIIASRRTVPVQPTEIVLHIDQPLTAATEQLERAAIERALALCDGRIDDAARMLGLSRKGLYLKRQRLGLE